MTTNLTQCLARLIATNAQKWLRMTKNLIARRTADRWSVIGSLAGFSNVARLYSNLGNEVRPITDLIRDPFCTVLLAVGASCWSGRLVVGNSIKATSPSCRLRIDACWTEPPSPWDSARVAVFACFSARDIGATDDSDGCGALGASSFSITGGETLVLNSVRIDCHIETGSLSSSNTVWPMMLYPCCR